MGRSDYSLVSMIKWALYSIAICGTMYLSFYAGKIYCTLNKLSVVPSNEVWYRVKPFKQTVEKCVTQCSENW